jgi:3D (Asp-Asp-Asp) domain-containing protein
MILKLILLIVTLLFSPPQVEEAKLYGKCRITFYCSCAECCGEWAGGPTASGVMPTVDHTVAADLPFGTRLRIDSQEYVVEDRGVSGMAVDIFVDSHDEALRRGMFESDVYIIGN